MHRNLRMISSNNIEREGSPGDLVNILQKVVAQDIACIAKTIVN
jgi:hypothetical protein